MSSRNNTYQAIIDFNVKTFQEKAKRRKQEARLPFEAKLEIVEQLNALVRDFAERRTKNREHNPPAS